MPTADGSDLFCLSDATVLNSSFELSCIPEERRGVLSYMD